MNTLIPEGTYRARAKSAEFGYSGNDKEQALVVFELLHPDYDGQSVIWHGSLTEKTAERTMQALRYCGWKGDDVTVLDGVTDNDVDIVVEHSTWEGKTRAKVRWVNRLGGSGVSLQTPANEAQRKSFSQKMKGLAVKSRQDVAAQPLPKIDPNDDVGF